MRNRWFHVPVLHVAHGAEKKVSWLELFYDLIFVASIIQLGDGLSENVTIEGYIAFAGHFVPLWFAWTGFTFYMNRFSVDDFLHRVLVFLSMFAVGTMAITAAEAMAGRPQLFALAYGVAQGLIALMYYRAWRDVPDARPYSRYWGTVFAVGSVCFLVSVLVPHPYCYALWALGIGAIFFSPISRLSRALTEQFPIDMEHLSERYGLLTIIVLGESFVKVVSFLGAGHGTEAEYIVKGILNLLITCCIWWIYFDDVAGSRVRQGPGQWMAWLYGHIPLTLAITGVAVGVKKAIKFDFGAPADDPYRWLLAGSLALTLFSVAIIDSVTERRNAELSDRARVNVRLGSAGLVLLMAQVGSGMSSALFLGILTAVCLAQVLFDMMMAPLEEASLDTAGPVGISDRARKKAAGHETKRLTRVREGARTVIKGAPNELRRDIYFFFMEGSWKRLFGSLGFLYLITNVFFAGLYLLEPGSIYGAGAESFADAFFFSVQTMSTIGYGSLHPATAYADMMVAIEAAIGLLGVAMATGLMFAKASRPQSSVVFSDTLVLTTRHGLPTLCFRAGNARGNDVVDASVTFSALMDEITPEGHHLRKLHTLGLQRSRTPLFSLSWAVIHAIDEDSPLHGVDFHDPEGDVLFIVTLTGHDGTYGQTMYARRLYYPEDIRVGHRFVDVISQLDDGRMMLDYTYFHDTVPDDEATAPDDEDPAPV